MRRLKSSWRGWLRLWLLLSILWIAYATYTGIKGWSLYTTSIVERSPVTLPQEAPRIERLKAAAQNQCVENSVRLTLEPDAIPSAQASPQPYRDWVLEGRSNIYRKLIRRDLGIADESFESYRRELAMLQAIQGRERARRLREGEVHTHRLSVSCVRHDTVRDQFLNRVQYAAQIPILMLLGVPILFAISLALASFAAWLISWIAAGFQGGAPKSGLNSPLVGTGASSLVPNPPEPRPVSDPTPSQPIVSDMMDSEPGTQDPTTANATGWNRLSFKRRLFLFATVATVTDFVLRGALGGGQATGTNVLVYVVIALLCGLLGKVVAERAALLLSAILMIAFTGFSLSRYL